MKLIEKKCPNCGASLSFSTTDKEVTCNYCNARFEVQREVSDIINTERIEQIANDIFNPENFSLHEKTIRSIGNVFIFIWAFVFIIAIIMFFIIATQVLS